mgnify:CR=1 FL=1
MKKSEVLFRFISLPKWNKTAGMEPLEIINLLNSKKNEKENNQSLIFFYKLVNLNQNKTL